jgi:hypothetical protein
VTIYADGTAVGTVSADASGNYTYTFAVALTDGAHSVTATATDATSNTSAQSAALNITIDTQAPAIPTITTAKTPTNDNTPTVTGTAEANSTVTIYADGTAVGIVTADASGNYTYTFAVALTDGAHTVTATATDATGNTSAQSAALNITIDTQAPAVPTITTAKTPTNDNTPTVTGTAESNSTVTIYVDGTAVSTVSADASGNYTFTFTTPLSDGTHALTATAADATGNTSAQSAALSITIDTQAPTAPTITTTKTPTNDNTPTITGKAEPNSTVTIYDGNTVVGTVPANANGDYTYTFTPALSDGTHNITTTATDAAGNTGQKSTPLPIVVDAHGPATPPAPVLADGSTGGLINDPAPAIKGTAEGNSTVTIYLNGNAVGTTTADAAGNYTYTFNPALADGSYAITVTATDAAGNTSAQSPALNITIDAAAPATPAAPQLIDGNSGITSDATPSIKGNTEPNSTVTVYADGKPVGTTKADGNGKYTYTFDPALEDGPHNITVTASDAAGNISGQSPALAVVIDTQAPAAPTVMLQTPAKDGVISTNKPTVTGAAEANSTVTVYAGGVAVGTAKADASGQYTYTFDTALSQGLHTITTTATDAAGNTSLPSATLSFSIVTIVPATPAAPILPGIIIPGLVNTGEPTITGKGEPGTLIIIYTDGKPMGSANVNASGNWSYTYNPILKEGSYEITVTASDKQHNESAHSTPVVLTVDLTKPKVSMLTSGAESISGPVTFFFTFSEDVIDFDVSDINVMNGSVIAFKQVTATRYEALIAPADNGTMAVDVPANGATDQAGNGNELSSTITLQVALVSDIDMVYPMPATDVVNVRFGAVKEGEVVITMTNMAGQMLLQQAGIVKNNVLTINTQRVPSGTYILLIRMKHQTFNTPVVIAR